MSNKMQRNAEKMPKKARTVLYNLIKDIRKNGPVQPYYSNYSKLGQNTLSLSFNVSLDSRLAI